MYFIEGFFSWKTNKKLCIINWEKTHFKTYDQKTEKHGTHKYLVISMDIVENSLWACFYKLLKPKNILNPIKLDRWPALFLDLQWRCLFTNILWQTSNAFTKHLHLHFDYMTNMWNLFVWWLLEIAGFYLGVSGWRGLITNAKHTLGFYLPIILKQTFF